MAVFQRNAALRGLADVRNDVAAFDGIAANQLGHRRLAGWQVVDKMTQSFVAARATVAFKKSNASAIGMLVGMTAPLRKAAKAEGHVRGRVAVHTEQLAHGQSTSCFSVCGLGTGCGARSCPGEK